MLGKVSLYKMLKNCFLRLYLPKHMHCQDGACCPIGWLVLIYIQVQTVIFKFFKFSDCERPKPQNILDRKPPDGCEMMEKKFLENRFE